MDEARAHADRVGSIALRAFVVLLVLNALIAIAAILGAAGEDEWRVVGTTLLLTAACLVVAANAAAVERETLRHVPYAAAATGTAAVAGLIVAIWAEDLTDREIFWKPVIVLIVLGLSGTYASVTSLADLWRSWELARWTGWLAATVIAVMTIVAIVFETTPPGELYAIVSIVLATTTIVVLIGAVAVRRADRAGATPADSAAAGTYCPRCRSGVAPELHVGSYACPTCGLRFTVDPVPA